MFLFSTRFVVRFVDVANVAKASKHANSFFIRIHEVLYYAHLSFLSSATLLQRAFLFEPFDVGTSVSLLAWPKLCNRRVSRLRKLII